MESKALVSRLPKDTVIDFAGGLTFPPRLHIRMTLSTLDELDALQASIEVFRKIMEIGRAETPRAPEAAASKDEAAKPGQVQGEPQKD